MGESKVRMADVTAKEKTHRTSAASGIITMEPSTLEALEQGRVEKGDVISVAHVAAVQAAKMTPLFIPLCHPLNITGVDVRFDIDRDLSSLRVETTVKGYDRTGYEMEALTAAAAALLTIYDMLKPLDGTMQIGPLMLVAKSGGKSGNWKRKETSKGS